MSRVFQQLQIFGWDQVKENILLASLLTGDRALLISQPGAAKTILPQKIAKALNLTFAAFDVNAQKFDDIIGVPNIEAMKRGKLEYIKAPGTIWGKSFVSFEEINRPNAAIQGKVLEHLRSGTIGSVSTDTRWVWANMNPIGHAGTNKLTPALIDRFSFYLWAPDAIDMTNEAREKIAGVMTTADAPALDLWLEQGGANAETIARFQDTTDYKAAGATLHRVLCKAAQYWQELEDQYKGMSSFVAMFADMLHSSMVSASATGKEAIEPIRLSGRRLAMIRRAIFSYRAVELALSAELNVYPAEFRSSLQVAINAAIPVGINEEEAPHERMRAFINKAIREAYHRLEACDTEQGKLQYTLFCSRDPVERARILLEGKITSAEVLNTGWQRMADMNTDEADLLAFIVVQVDARVRASGKDGIIPSNVLDTMKSRITDKHVMPELPRLPTQLLPHLGDLNNQIIEATGKDPIMGLIAVQQTHKFVTAEPEKNWETLQVRIRDSQREYRDLMDRAGV